MNTQIYFPVSGTVTLSNTLTFNGSMLRTSLTNRGIRRDREGEKLGSFALR